MGDDLRQHVQQQQVEDEQVSSDEFDAILDQLGVEELPEPAEDGEYFEKRWRPPPTDGAAPGAEKR